MGAAASPAASAASAAFRGRIVASIHGVVEVNISVVGEMEAAVFFILGCAHLLPHRLHGSAADDTHGNDAQNHAAHRRNDDISTSLNGSRLPTS